MNFQAYLWEKNEDVVKWLEQQRKPESTVTKNIIAVKKDAIISQIQKSLEVNFCIKFSFIQNCHSLFFFEST